MFTTNNGGQGSTGMFLAVKNFTDISPAHILLVTNSSIAQSDTDAANYISARGLTDNRLRFNFGSGASSNNLVTDSVLSGSAGSLTVQSATVAGVSNNTWNGQHFYAAISAYITANNIEAVILSTWCPSSSQSTCNGAPPNVALACMCGNAPYFNHFGIGGGVNYPSAGIAPARAADWRKWALANFQYPHGHLGAPLVVGGDGSTVIGQVTLYNGGGNVAQNCWTGAIAAEASAATQRALYHVLTDNLSYSTIVTVPDNQQSVILAKRCNFPWVNMGSNPTVPGYYTDGTVSPPINIGLWMHGGSDFATNSHTGNWWSNGTAITNVSNFVIQTGAAYFSYHSGCGADCQWFLSRGGLCAIGDVGEPVSTGIPAPQNVYQNLFTWRCSMMLAAFLDVSWNRGSGTVWGDPMYSVFKNLITYSGQPTG